MNTIHLYWGRSRPLSWLKLQTVVTFARHNPSWQVKVWYREHEPVGPKWSSGEQVYQYTGPDYFDELVKVAQIVKVPFDYPAPDVTFSDYLRWWLLATEGGWWSDFDILYTAPMPSGHGPMITRYPCGVWPVGFLGAPDEEARQFFRGVESVARGIVGSATGYQDLGCMLLGKLAKRKPPCFPYVYPEVQPRHARVSYFESGGYCIPEGYIGCHWFAGADFAAKFENAIADGTAYKSALVLRVTA